MTLPVGWQQKDPSAALSLLVGTKLICYQALIFKDKVCSLQKFYESGPISVWTSHTEIKD